MCFWNLTNLLLPNLELDEDLHQKIAKEMNLSETAFIRKLHPNDNFTQSKYTFFFSFKTILNGTRNSSSGGGIIFKKNVHLLFACR